MVRSCQASADIVVVRFDQLTRTGGARSVKCPPQRGSHQDGSARVKTDSDQVPPGAVARQRTKRLHLEVFTFGEWYALGEVLSDREPGKRAF